jgi:hypothetical protein
MRIQLDLGDFVCDMHDVPARTGAIIDEKWIIAKIIQVRTNKASEMLNLLLPDFHLMSPNKHAVVVGETYDGQGYQCAYSYDGDRFGLFEIEPY